MSLSLVARLQRPRPIAFAVSLVLAWLLLALIAFALRRGPIQNDLAARATAAVRAAGGVHAQVRIDGRQAVVTGRFPSAVAAERARASAAVAGTTSARLGDDVVIATEAARPLELAVDGQGLSVTATVPDRASRSALLAAVADASGGAVTGQIRIDPAAAEPPVEAVPALAAALRAVPGRHSATIEGRTVAVAGSAPDAAARQRLGAGVLAATGSAVPGIALDDRLVVPRATPARGAAATSPGSTTGPGATAGQGADGPRAAASGTSDSTASTSTSSTSTSSAGRTLAAVRAALGDRDVTFPVALATLTASARARLDRVADALKAGDLPVLVVGYTDASGPPAFNQALSLDRAQTAADYLTGRGVPADLVRAAGFGSRAPVGDNATPRGRAANRRVTITPLPDRPSSP